TVEEDTTTGDPTATDDSVTTDEDTPVDIDVLANDSAANAGELSVTSATDPANGSVIINADDTITYTPDAGFTGTDTFDYTVEEADGGTATATVTVTVEESDGNGGGGECTNGTRVELGWDGLGFCIADPNPDFMEPGESLFPDGLFPGGLFPDGLFPNGLWGNGDTGNGDGNGDEDDEDGTEDIAAQASMPELNSLGDEISHAIDEAFGR
ncbi:MAG: Ig-like domain-containing protein, partial [Dehalococcoidia bacterium]